MNGVASNTFWSHTSNRTLFNKKDRTDALMAIRRVVFSLSWQPQRPIHSHRIRTSRKGTERMPGSIKTLHDIHLFIAVYDTIMTTSAILSMPAMGLHIFAIV
jgi:hypothetical protein